jgi:hypothetical protein
MFKFKSGNGKSNKDEPKILNKPSYGALSDNLDENIEIIKKIFDLATTEGYGSRRISKYLNENEIPTKRGGKWAGTTILIIIKHLIYKRKIILWGKKV